MKKFNLSTIEGCRKVIALLMCCILVFSFIGCLIQRSGGKVSMKDVQFDTRGGVQDADLYYPAGTNSHSEPMPCVVLSHGGGCTKDVLDTIAIELARRGFVVLNCSSYGAGLSDQPDYDENDKGKDGMAVTAQGLWDAVNYVRTLTFVDQTKIAVGGHSQGGYRASYAAALDCTYFTLNDMMINFMHDELGIEFTEEEIGEDAAVLAEKYLNDDQKLFYEAKLKENTEYYNTRVLVSIPMGSASNGAVQTNVLAPVTVNVGGYEVERHLQCNILAAAGFYVDMASIAEKNLGITGLSNMEYYKVGDGPATKLGLLGETHPASTPVLKEAIADRSTRMFLTVDKMAHSREFFSNEMTMYFVEYLAETMEYNRGPDPSNVGARWKEYMNTFAMWCMIFLAAAVVAFLIKKPFFSTVAVEHDSAEYKPMEKWTNVIYTLLTIAAAFYGCWRAHKRKPVIFNTSKFLPQDKTAAFLFIYIFFTAVILLAVMAVFVYINKRKNGDTGLKKLGIGIKFKDIMKSLLVSVLVIFACYLSLAIIEYLFRQDYRWWMCIFTEMKLYHWTQAARYFVIVLPFIFVTCAAVNYNVKETSKRPGLDILLCVVIGSLGVWINHFINMYGVHVLGREISSASICGGLMMFVPLSMYIARKTYKVTGSIWTGAFINSMLIGWSWTSAISITNMYMGQTFLEKLFGF